jgi:SAM-dependent methyltransferase
VLEIGCGRGRLTRALAARVPQVTSVDLSPEMIAIARSENAAANVRFVVGDALEVVPHLGAFDCVATVATFHHLPQSTAAACMKAAVAPGGRLILHDLWRVESRLDRLLDGVRLPVKLVQLLRTGAPLLYPADERAAWRAHQRDDVHLTLREVEALQRHHFPGAAVYRHFLWRYTLVWENP